MRRMNRRGSFTEALQWIFRILAAVILLLLLLGQISMLTSYRKTPNSMELALYTARLVHGPDGIFAEDPTGRIIPGVVDPNKLTERHLIEAYDQREELFAAHLRLYDDASKIDTADFKTEAYNPPDRDVFTTYAPLGKAGLIGSGGAFYERHLLPILIQTPDGRIPGWLEVEVLKRT